MNSSVSAENPFHRKTQNINFSFKLYNFTFSKYFQKFLNFTFIKTTDEKNY